MHYVVSKHTGHRSPLKSFSDDLTREKRLVKRSDLVLIRHETISKRMTYAVTYLRKIESYLIKPLVFGLTFVLGGIRT